jgi:hypothetical protein
MFDKDKDKVLKVLSHPQNRPQHLTALKKYVKLFYSKWNKEITPTNSKDIIEGYLNLIK